MAAKENETAIAEAKVFLANFKQISLTDFEDAPLSLPGR